MTWVECKLKQEELTKLERILNILVIHAFNDEKI